MILFNNSNSKKIVIMLTLILTITSGICRAQWQSDVRLTFDAASSFMSGNSARCVSSNGDNVSAIWFDNRDGNSEIYFKRSSEKGASWGNDTRLTFNSASSIFPSAASSDSNLHIVWEEYRDGNAEIYYKRSANNGFSWGQDFRLTNNYPNSFSPAISVNGPFVHVVWFDYRDGNAEIYYKRSIDAGATWGADTRLTYNNALSHIPAISLFPGSNGVHVVWEDKRDGNEEIYYKHSTDNGNTWCPDTRLTFNWAKSLSPEISVSMIDNIDNIHIVWFDERDGNQEIYFKHSSNDGANWCPDTRLTNNSNCSKNPSVHATENGSVHLFWQDDRDGNFEVYNKRSLDNGQAWSVDKKITSNNAQSIFPFVTVSDKIVSIIWEEYRDGNPEVYFKRDSTGNPEAINLKITMIVEGFYNLNSNHLNRKDPVKAILRSSTSPYGVIDSAGAIIDSLTFSGIFYFTNAPAGQYFIIVKHRNSIETWSKDGGEFLSKNVLNSYNFSNDIKHAFGMNLKELASSPVRFALYSGDVNQDGFIEVTDLSEIDNDVFNYLYGNPATDIDGNGMVDLSDISIADNNALNYVSLIRP